MTPFSSGTKAVSAASCLLMDSLSPYNVYIIACGILSVIAVCSHAVVKCPSSLTETFPCPMAAGGYDTGKALRQKA